MKALAIKPGKNEVGIIDHTEPVITKPGQVKIRVMEVGICGTDREEASGGRADSPEGEDKLIIGHEMFGEVVETGKDVRTVSVGDYGVFTVRRGCGKCSACSHNRSDMCQSGEYTERGIKGYHGFQTQYVVDNEQYLVKVPGAIKHLGVLTEPMSVAAKAIDEALILQAARFPFLDSSELLKDKKVLVAGLGSIGLLLAFALRLRGAVVIGLDIVEESSLRPSILKSIGGSYIDGKKISTLDIDKEFGQIDFIFEAAGIGKLQFELIDALGINGIYVVTGIASGKRQVCIEGGQLMQQLVLRNQIVLGSVNAGPKHYKMAVADLEQCKNKWGEIINKIITQRLNIKDYKQALLEHNEGEIKTVIEWNFGDQ